MIPFTLGATVGMVLLAVVVVVGSHVFIEIADGRLAPF